MLRREEAAAGADIWPQRMMARPYREKVEKKWSPQPGDRGGRRSCVGNGISCCYLRICGPVGDVPLSVLQKSRKIFDPADHEPPSRKQRKASSSPPPPPLLLGSGAASSSSSYSSSSSPAAPGMAAAAAAEAEAAAAAAGAAADRPGPAAAAAPGLPLLHERRREVLQREARHPPHLQGLRDQR